LGADRHRGRENLFRGRADVLARECHRARARHSLCAARRHGHRSIAGMAQPRWSGPDCDRAGALCRLGMAGPARRRPGGGGRGLAGGEGWSGTLAWGPVTLLQIGIGIVDLGFCALAMYMLVPDEPNIGFVTLAVIFVSATLLGFASHAPGGIGVFDAAMLVAL